MTALGQSGVCSWSAIADPKQTQKAGPGSGWGLLSVRLCLVSTVHSTSYKTFDIEVNSSVTFI